MNDYKIVRYFQSGRKRVIESGVSLEDAQAHCKDPESSSTTCKSSYKKAYTRAHGPWFDGYTEDN